MPVNPRKTQEFVSLLTDSQEVLKSYIISQLPGSPDVADILQEINILLWERMEDFKLGTNFGAWACTQAYYKVLDYRKKKKREGFIVFNEDLYLALTSDSGERELDVFRSKRRALDHCLKKLTPKQRKLMITRYQSKGGMAALVENTGRTNDSLRVSLHRLRVGLRNCIEKRLALKGGSA